MNPFKGKVALGTVYTAFILILLFWNFTTIAQPKINVNHNLVYQNEVVNYKLTNSFATYQWIVIKGNSSKRIHIDQYQSNCRQIVAGKYILRMIDDIEKPIQT